MEYPFFDVPMLGGSLLIAGVAIFHTFIAHFSVGSGFFMVIAERRAIREGDTATQEFLRKYALLILLVPYVLGTVTGVGIWFTVALVSPRAISVLIHQFVWDWALEWVLFLIEVTAIYLYFFTWGKVKPAVHNRIGWIFAAASVLTLIIINAILTFMLTPGAWAPHAPGAVWKAILNPSYLPTTLVRIAISLAFAGVGAIALATFGTNVKKGVRLKVVRQAYWMIVPTALCLPLAGWIFAVLTPRAQAFLTGGAPVMALFLAFGMTSFTILFLASAFSLWRKDFSVSTLGSCLLVLFAFVSFGSFEFVREGARKPFVIEGFMYSTGVTVEAQAGLDRRANITRTRRKGVVASSPWSVPPGKKIGDLTLPELGKAVYEAACLRCHSVDGYNAMRPLVAGWKPETI
ncbi:cytochrome ubiquinol oxidase subunit I, partial [bacterium]|nr:cytochrome ubiquinol oxidase subunit I [bacterium]